MAESHREMKAPVYGKCLAEEYQRLQGGERRASGIVTLDNGVKAFGEIKHCNHAARSDIKLKYALGVA